MAHVLRDGVERQVVGADLVPGDVVTVAAGAGSPRTGVWSRAFACRSTRRR